jgi:hypothetical protein
VGIQQDDCFITSTIGRGVWVPAFAGTTAQYLVHPRLTTVIASQRVARMRAR